MPVDNSAKVTHWLEMADRNQFRPFTAETRPPLEVRRVEIACPEYNWFLHQCVGTDFRWGGRHEWGPAEWTQYVDRPELETWVAYVAGCPAGYYELQREADGSVQIVCFGLRRPFIGQGLGRAMLSGAVARCWEMGAVRVWLTTCSHDHPHALHNYLARGFRVVKQTSGPANAPRDSALFTPARSATGDD